MAVDSLTTGDVWWNVRLNQNYKISQVIIFNSWTLGRREKIKGFVLKILDEGGNTVFTHTDSGSYVNTETPRSFIINVGDIVGRDVKIELPSRDDLMLQEVMVFGEEALGGDGGAGGGEFIFIIYQVSDEKVLMIL